MTLESAIKSYKYGYSVTYDADNHKTLYGTKCNHCGEYFENEKIDYYCTECKNKEESIV